jgi:hypothetical protein
MLGERLALAAPSESSLTPSGAPEIVQTVPGRVVLHPLARLGTVGADGAGDRRRGAATGVAEVSVRCCQQVLAGGGARWR